MLDNLLGLAIEPGVCVLVVVRGLGEIVKLRAAKAGGEREPRVCMGERERGGESLYRCVDLAARVFFQSFATHDQTKRSAEVSLSGWRTIIRGCMCVLVSGRTCCVSAEVAQEQESPGVLGG